MSSSPPRPDRTFIGRALRLARTALFAWLISLTAAADAAGPGLPWAGAAFEGDRELLRKLADAGAKVVRVYRESDAWVLDAAHELGLKVVMGLWVNHPRHGFALDDRDALQAQEQRLRDVVTRHRGHPALLAWGVGNEVETGEADPLPAWREVNRLAAIVRQLDPTHPTMMVVADTDMAQLKRLAACCPDVALLGINVYAGAVFDLPARLREAGIAKPVVVTELGPLGQWQAGRKPWGAPVEPTSTEKARFFRDALAFLREQAQVVGAFPFLWGAKQEQTATWHGLLLAEGSPTAMTDALSEAWGHTVLEPAPLIRGIGIAADVFAPGVEISAGVDALSFDASPLQAGWTVREEATDLRKGGDAEAAPAEVPVRVLHADARSVRFVAPARPGPYRLFITLKDRQGKAATANLPFLVR